ncbi:glycosyl transferase [Edaphobacter sp. HDX4]|uniref:glucoamylase family protein n=1 Tax=Edaphobacter sp. HDX4 TaxID=2794064 RepID=UPI002FE5AB2B
MALSEDLASAHVAPLTAPVQETAATGLPEEPTIDESELRRHADELSQKLRGQLPGKSQEDLVRYLEHLRKWLAARVPVWKQGTSTTELTPKLELVESARMFESVIPRGEGAAATFKDVPVADLPPVGLLPQVIHLAGSYLTAVDGIWSPRSLSIYVEQLQHHHPLQLREIELLPDALKIAQLEFLLNLADAVFAAGEMPPIEQSPFSAPIHSLRRMNQIEWRDILEPLVPFDAVLRLDPGGVFGRMEEETRAAYRLRVAELARHADTNEVQTAQIALELAQAAERTEFPDPRMAKRKSHIGYYLVADGIRELKVRIGFRPSPTERLREWVGTYNEEFYILGTFVLALLLITAIILPLVPHHDFWPVMAALLLALLPATQGAVDLVNGLVTTLMKTEALPKLDFSKGIPQEAATLVVVPTLLLNEQQVQDLLDELEARYLSNQDENLHFALLTDLPDTAARPPQVDEGPLVDMAARAIDQLNRKYAGRGAGSFLLLHRHRAFNARQGVWMGWERKRGKLLDLNRLLEEEHDSFPRKAGPLGVLEHIRYVITLDSDTQLPHGTAARMIGTIVHPLNRAIIHPKLRIVTAGYGILQPRVGVSVSSASRSRLAALYSGETGFDVYARAVSDAYQDLFGEGIFTGKGIYDVSAFHQVLNHRFPRNALLSHDLIEGAYARAGLVSDIEVIDDYPSHYSAHMKRKHRWVRGDWQILRWLFNVVPDEYGKLVLNPISTISRWKILDNLRRSLIEPIVFLLFVFGWFFLPGGALYWTVAVLLLVLLPGLVQLGFNVSRAIFKGSFAALRDGLLTFISSLSITLLNLIFLPHHMLLSLDAIVRSLVRLFLSGNNLLDWETAAQSEASAGRGSLDTYLKLSPLISLTIALGLALAHPEALFAAAPVLVLWALAPAVATWVNSPPRAVEGPLKTSDREFLERQALLIWRYFAEFGGPENHWLIPDNVEEKDTHQVRKLSPTNLGMLLNARQAACEFGFITPEWFAQATLGTFETYERLEKQRGHIYNWYDIETLQAISPKIVSAVDSGNLAASFYSLHSGALELLKKPLLPEQWTSQNSTSSAGAAQEWVEEERRRCRLSWEKFVESYAPWQSSRFESLFKGATLVAPPDPLTLAKAGGYTNDLEARLATVSGSADVQRLAAELRELLPAARERISQLCADLESIADRANRYAEAMEYGFLMVKSRKLLSIGYDGVTGELYGACYDLLASEARMAFFLAVAKGDIDQESWFRLDRSHVLVKGRACLLSWTGTMFEYMMPALWMRPYANTLITQSLESAVRIQRNHVRNIPWGISESGFAKTDDSGRYGYQAWGIPQIALKYGAEDGPVISPYSSFLALPLLRDEAVANIRRMASMGWVGDYGFCEAADYTESREPRIVRSWMAHHQGMSLLAITNLLHDGAFQRWFHATPIVRATELLLHEKPLSKESREALDEAVVAKPEEKAASTNSHAKVA